MPLSLEQAVARVPQWAGAKELETVLLGGGITHQNIRAAATHAPVCEIHTAMWGAAQTHLSKLDFFRGYAGLWFGRATGAIHNPRWGDWLKEITHG